ncbi:AI-2E family transporter [Rhodoferax lacus]|uniref:AI-2E family transporter n=1 Tax=Rhodoferax lacus TaxID=2184758 RepID=A0A3E1RG47_9BURK|nr:AI-2E family transporter [Rhodoferax lacus]RFO98357.1 AI-2E family transporter [Rhodoferax lacus]
MQFTPTQKTLAAWGAIAAAFLLALWLLAPVLAPFVVAAVLAYALTPVVDWLDDVGRGRVPRVLAVLVVELLFVIAVLALVLLVIPILAKELPLIRDQLPVLLERAVALVQPLLTQWGFEVALDMESVRGFVKAYLDTNFQDALGSVLSSLKIGGSVAFSLIGNLVLIPVVLFYLLMEWDGLVQQLRQLIPPALRPASDHFVRDADAVLGQYLRGQMLVMLLLAVYYSVGLKLFGLDLALPIGVFTGLAVFVPYLGFGLGLALATFAGLLQFTAASGFSHTVLMLVVVFGVGQLLESFVLTPKLVGERIGLHPLAVIFSLMAFGQLFGFLGVLVALPVSAVLLVAIRRVRTGYLASHLYKG